jgi:hypothetical protein
MSETERQHRRYSLRKTFLLPLRTFCLRFVLPRRCASFSSTESCGRPPFSIPAPNVSMPSCFFCFPPSDDVRGWSIFEDGTQVSSIPPSIDLLTYSEGRLFFDASFLLAPNVAAPRESLQPSRLALRGAIRTEVNGLAAFCFRLALMNSRSRNRSWVGSAAESMPIDR